MRTIENRKQFHKRGAAGQNRRNITESTLYKELEAYQNAGISLWLNGRPSTSYGIASYVREEADYMRDYQFDRDNVICAVGFDRVREKTKR